jgi:hypothetical protein
MTKTFAPQAAAFAAAALLTLAVFSGTSALAGHEYRAAMVAQAQTQTQDVAIAVQRVTVIGHRTAQS